MTRIESYFPFKRPNLKSRIQRASLSFRRSKIFNMLRDNNLVIDFFDNLTHSDNQSVAHNQRDLYILSNEDIVKCICR